MKVKGREGREEREWRGRRRVEGREERVEGREEREWRGRRRVEGREERVEGREEREGGEAGREGQGERDTREEGGGRQWKHLC